MEAAKNSLDRITESATRLNDRKASNTEALTEAERLFLRKQMLSVRNLKGLWMTTLIQQMRWRLVELD